MFNNSIVRVYRREEQDNGKQGWTYQAEYNTDKIPSELHASGTYKLVILGINGNTLELIKTVQTGGN
jgi:hypothetical protein